jgi:hypothetical protein
MSLADENKAKQRRLVEVVQNDGNIEATDEFIAPDAVDHSAPPGIVHHMIAEG